MLNKGPIDLSEPLAILPNTRLFYMFIAKVTIQACCSQLLEQKVSPQGAVNLKNKKQIY
jgi:hypothetical protein